MRDFSAARRASPQEGFQRLAEPAGGVPETCRARRRGSRDLQEILMTVEGRWPQEGFAKGVPETCRAEPRRRRGVGRQAHGARDRHFRQGHGATESPGSWGQGRG